MQVITGLAILTILRLGIPIAVIFGISALLGQWNSFISMEDRAL